MAVAIATGVWAPAVAVTVSAPVGRLGPGQIKRIVTALITVGTEINELLHS